MTHIGAIDQGTTSTRFVIVDRAGAIVAFAQRAHAQHTPAPGLLEHDPHEIVANVRATMQEALARAGLTLADLHAIGIANQRETTVLWDRRTGRALHPALVWQDSRVDDRVAEHARAGDGTRLRALTGLPLASYFSALKLQWLLDHVPGARAAAEAGHALFGTIDAWLAWQLCGEHVTDVTNASRTQLMDLHTRAWSDELLALFRIPRACLPRIVPSSAVLGQIGGVPLAGMLGDQQAALVGQACFAPGEAKNTYGTGNFLLMNTGTTPIASQAGLLTTLAYRFGDAPPCFALEGSIAVTGALLHWLRDQLRLVSSAAEVDALAASVPDSAGVTIVPAFSGLYAPYWREQARGIITGLTRFADRAHLCRAALEATAFQTRDVADAMALDSGIALQSLRVDGGMVRSVPLMQFQADMLARPVIRPAITETTALGAAYAAGLATGFWPDTAALRGQWREDCRWTPAMPEDRREEAYARWLAAVARA